MSEDWGDRGLFSSMIVPRYHNDWGHASLHMPAVTKTPAGDQQVYMIDLLSYPWLAHELGHNLMFRHDRHFIPAASEHLDALVRKLRLAAIPDRGRARAGSERSVQELTQFWRPSDDHRNWSHELGADLIALWVLGPAYLAVFQDLLEESTQNPYQVSPVHPPYAVRVCALLNGAGRLGFEADARALAKLAGSWRSSAWAGHRTNRFLRLADAGLVEAVVQVTLEFCQRLGLTQCTSERLASLETTLSDLDSSKLRHKPPAKRLARLDHRCQGSNIPSAVVISERARIHCRGGHAGLHGEDATSQDLHGEGRPVAHQMVFVPSVGRMLAEGIVVLPKVTQLWRGIVFEVSLDRLAQNAGNDCTTFRISRLRLETPGQRDTILRRGRRIGEFPACRYRHLPRVEVDDETVAAAVNSVLSPQVPNDLLCAATVLLRLIRGVSELHSIDVDRSRQRAGVQDLVAVEQILRRRYDDQRPQRRQPGSGLRIQTMQDAVNSRTNARPLKRP